MTITLTPSYLNKGKLYREGFYVTENNGLYWLGHQYGKVGEYHQVPISKEFYEQFNLESQKNIDKYNKIFLRK